MKSVKLLSLVLFLSTLLFLPQCKLWEPERVEVPCPAINLILPNKAHFDETVTISGINFIPQKPSFHQVWIGEVEIPTENILEVPDAKTLKFKVPKGIGTGKITVKLKNAPNCSSNQDIDFFYLYTPTASIFAGTPNDNTSTCQNCLNAPKGLDVDKDGNVFLANRGDHTIIKFSPNGTRMYVVGRRGTGDYRDDPEGNIAMFRSPNDLAVDASNNVYVADETNHCIRKIANNAPWGVTTIAGKGGKPGNITRTALLDARYTRPSGICIGIGGKIYVSELSRNRIRELDINSTSGFDQIIVGDTSGTVGDFKTPIGITFTNKRPSEGPLLVADQGNSALKFIKFPGFNVTKILSGIVPSPYAAPSDLVVNDNGVLFTLDQNKIIAIYPGGSNTYDVVNTGFSFGRLYGAAIYGKKLYVSDEQKHIIVKILLE